ADAADADDVAAAVADYRGVAAAHQVIPVALPALRVDRLVVGVEPLAARRRGLEHPARAEEVLLVHLVVAAAEVVVRAHLEGANHVLGERRGRRGKALLAGDVFVVALDGEVRVRAVPDDWAAEA